MITTILSDFSNVLLEIKDKSYSDGLNDLNRELTQKFGENYQFFDYFCMNTELLQIYRDLKRDYSLSVFTTDTIQNRPEIRVIIDPIMDNVFSAKDYGIKKTTPEAYSFIANKLGKKPEEILYIDDQQINIDAAKTAGMNVILYEGIDLLKNDLITHKLIKG